MDAFDSEGSLNVIVETPRGSTAKWKYADGIVKLSRALPLGLAYPFDWGFIPGTHVADGDPLDAMVYWDVTSYPGVVIPSRSIAVLKVEQTNRISGARERNDRVLVVPVKAAAIAISDLGDLPERARRELEHFFVAAVAFEGKDVRLLGWGDAEESRSAITASLSGR
jgi:inorganic pyrophosphatase